MDELNNILKKLRNNEKEFEKKIQELDKSKFLFINKNL